MGTTGPEAGPERPLFTPYDGNNYTPTYASSSMNVDPNLYVGSYPAIEEAPDPTVPYSPQPDQRVSDVLKMRLRNMPFLKR